MGALAARSPKAGNLARYGLHLGLAFQAVDDILDATEEGRRNVARIYGLKRAHQLAAQEVAAAKAAVRFMGGKGERLRQIADFVIARKH
jgi:geranylgeranyl pyrophosphate synthase